MSIIEGKQGLSKYWAIPEGAKILHHELQPAQVNIIGNVAYDYGYFQGKTSNADGNIGEFKGKYVVIWKKVGYEWKMYLDIWNRVQDQAQ